MVYARMRVVCCVGQFAALLLFAAPADLQLVTARELGVKPVFDHTKVPTKTKQKGAPISLIVCTFIDTRCFGIMMPMRCFGIHVACFK